MMQQLGIGLKGLMVILGMMPGIAAGMGDYQKWKNIQEVVGAAQQECCEECIHENIEEEIEATIAAAIVPFQEWLDSEEGMAATEEDALEKFEGHCNVVNDKVGIAVGMDVAWQKRASGHSYSSKTGHNFCIDWRTGKICGVVWFSKHCRLCEAAARNNRDPVEHRCPRNFPLDKSAKSMEGIGAVQHCTNIARRVGDKVQAYVHTLVTDDDSTTRANVQWSRAEWLDEMYGKGNWTKALVGWPRTSNADNAA
jgi:hypothetical protein